MINLRVPVPPLVCYKNFDPRWQSWWGVGSTSFQGQEAGKLGNDNMLQDTLQVSVADVCASALPNVCFLLFLQESNLHAGKPRTRWEKKVWACCLLATTQWVDIINSIIVCQTAVLDDFIASVKFVSISSSLSSASVDKTYAICGVSLAKVQLRVPTIRI